MKTKKQKLRELAWSLMKDKYVIGLSAVVLSDIANETPGFPGRRVSPVEAYNILEELMYAGLINQLPYEAGCSMYSETFFVFPQSTYEEKTPVTENK